MIRRLILWIATVSCLTTSQAQVTRQYTYRQYTLKDGLPQMQVTHIMQDHIGYLWLSHWNGISRFDGRKFVTFTKDDGMVNHSCFEALEYRPDSMVVINPWGLSLGSLQGRFSAYPFPDKERPDRNSIVRLFGNQLFVGAVNDNKITTLRNYFFDPETRRYKYLPQLDGIQVMDAVVCSDILLMFTPDKIISIRMDGTLEKVIKLRNTYSDIVVSPQGVVCGYSRGDKEVYIIDKSGRETKSGYTIQREKPSGRTDANVIGLLPDGRLIYHDDQNEVYISDDRACKSLGRKFNVIQNYFCDRENNLWIATEEGVINYSKLGFEQFRLFSDKVSDMVWSVAQHDKTLYFGTNTAGLYTLDGDRLQKIEVAGIAPHDYEGNIERVYLGAATNSQGDTYIPFNKGMLTLQSDGSRRFFNVTGNPQGVAASPTRDTLYAAIRGGFMAIYPDRRTIEFGVEKGFGLYQNESVAQDRFGRIWVSASQKEYLQLYDPQTDSVIERQPELARNVISLTADSRGNIWMGNHNGLFTTDHKAETRFGAGVIDVPVYTIIPYSDSLLVVCTPVNVFMINLNDYYKNGKENIRSFGHYNGFTAEGCIQNSWCRDSEGYLWIPSITGTYRFNPALLSTQTHYADPIIERVLYSADRVEWFEYAGARLNYTECNLEFQVNCPTFDALNDIRYRYKLNGYDSDWGYITGNNRVRYTNLASGRYIFEIQSSVNGAQWSESVISSPVVIFPALWNTIVFRIGALVFLIGAIFFIAKFINRRKLARMEQRNRETSLRLKESELKLSSVRMKSFPHFGANVMANIESFAYQDDRAKLSHYLIEATQFFNLTLANVDIGVHTLDEELKYATTYLELEKLRFDDWLDYSVEVVAGVNLGVAVPTGFLYTFCENAIKHGLSPKSGDGKINIRIYNSDNGALVVEVEDNGIGREAALKSTRTTTGQGLRILETQIELYNSNNDTQIQLLVNDIDSDVATGTVFTIVITD